MTRLSIPDPSLVVLVGATGSGKSSFAAKHFAPTEVIASDRMRALICDDENDQSVSADAFEMVHRLAEMRLAHARMTVIDATSLEVRARQPLRAIAKRQHLPCVVIALDVSLPSLIARHAARGDRPFTEVVVEEHHGQLQRTLASLSQEGFREIHVLAEDEIDSVEIVREKLAPERREERGPFDVIGDVHGCAEELRELLETLGYAPDVDGAYRHPAGRRVIFVGDLVDRGPDVAGCLRIAMDMVDAGAALCVQGNHEAKILRWLQGKNIKPSHGADASIASLEQQPAAFRERAREFIDGLRPHYVLDGGGLVVAHAGLKESMHGRVGGKVRAFCLYGDTNGETDDEGLPVRLDWAQDYEGRAAVIYGHTPVRETRWVNGTICLDTGCVFGGKLTALRWPERELVSVAAKRVHYRPPRPLEER
ncbi:MAG: hypothetical protein EVA89_26135 [Sandaracinaceae bacterium]|nr:MAG: hypothetical protein EVA89_26135 [Sandaracinaceae bacterium]